MPPSASLTAVVVDDSHFMRTVISDILESGGIEVIDHARDGAQAVDSVVSHEPDVVTMDVEMPGVDGIEGVSRIMDARPTPILMLSAHTDERASVTFEAIHRGAVDFFTKPGGEVSLGMGRFEQQLLRKVEAVARSSIDVRRTGPTEPDAPRAIPVHDIPGNPTVVVGASTGGPLAVEQLLSALPVSAAFRILIVQHMPRGFTARFAERLHDNTEYSVREATDGAAVRGGEAVVARGGHHLVVAEDRGGQLVTELSDAPRRHGVRPAIDVTMDSAASIVEGQLVGVVLTGMGGDGAIGVQRVKTAGGLTIAQDEATSAVFGMPKRAIQTGRVDTVAPLADIPNAIIDGVTKEATP